MVPASKATWMKDTYMDKAGQVQVLAQLDHRAGGALHVGEPLLLDLGERLLGVL